LLVVRSIIVSVCLSSLGGPLSAGAETYDSVIKPLLHTYCVKCHGAADEISGDVDFTRLNSQTEADVSFDVWQTAVELVSEGLMPPADAPQPSDQEKAALKKWYQERFIDSIEAHPGFFRPRRLSAYEYRNTLHSLLGFPLEVVIMEAEQTVSEKSLVMKLLPTDPPGASGFKNDTSGNPLSTVIWDQYSYLIDNAMASLFSPQHRDALEAFTGRIQDAHLTQPQAAKLLRAVARRAYRRPIDDSMLANALAAIDGKSAETLETALAVELKTILMSPPFIYRGLLMNVPRDTLTPVDEFELAERLSYFLWGDMPDEELVQLADDGRLSDPDVYRAQIDRMLVSPKARNLAEDFGVQWFSLGEIRHVSDNPPVTDALRSQPIDFLNYLFIEGRRLVELIDCDTTFINPHTAKYYPVDRKQMAPYKKVKGIEVEQVANTQIKLVNTKERGGLLTMPGVLAMNRGPVLRGTWILERVLGQHLPDPPANVGQVADNKPGEKLSFRERFEAHRSNPSCAVCHDKIDPLGFALQAYDSGGGFIKSANYSSMKAKVKKKDRGKMEVDVPIDTSGRLPSGETFDDFQGLQQILVTKERERVIRNIVRRMIAYALCRKLEAYDGPTIEAIVKELNENDGTYHDLIHMIANSLPFRETVVTSIERDGEPTQP
jgi:cytochrome c553